MKKFLTGFSITAFFLLALAGALSVVPHTHDKAHHESEETCPVCQVIAHPVHLDIAIAKIVTIVLFVLFILSQSNYLYQPVFSSFVSLRAPPALI